MDHMFADYLHNLNPVLFEFNSSIKIHWYGIAYVLGFLTGYWCLMYLARRKIGVLPEKELADFITYAAIFGVLLGGRLGYVIFYAWDEFSRDPMMVFRLQSGGMASHGGILGLVFFTLYYAWRHRKSWPGVGDNLVSVAPLGLLFGRLANFVNGELYGEECKKGFPMAVRFPSELRDRPVTDLPEIAEKIGLPPGTDVDAIITAARTNPEVAQKLYGELIPRHPSQLYEAALEGVVLFVILFLVRVKFPRAPHGLLTGLFFILYAVFRMYIEAYYRVGDGIILGVSRGFFYSTFMVGIGAAFLIYSAKQGRRDAANAARDS